MDYRWITDGLSYEKLRYFNGKKNFLEKHVFHDSLLHDEYWQITISVSTKQVVGRCRRVDISCPKIKKT
jgi:hypothetical protein